MKKTFFNLSQEVQKQGKCSHCGGCATFCSAINYGALGIEKNGKPYFKDIEKCVECGLCYMICPQISELNNDIKRNTSWKAPFGNVIGISVARAKDPHIRQEGTDGGVVTAILLNLFNAGRIDGAIVSKNTDTGRIPCMARTEQDIINSAGSHFDHSQGIFHFANEYSTYSPSIKALGELKHQKLDRIAFVGTPCQIVTIRKMQALNIVPSDSVNFCLGLFCSGNYHWDRDIIKTLETQYAFSYDDVIKINIKDHFIFSLSSGKQINIPVENLAGAKRPACNFCSDFSAQYSDLSFGGLGAENGWTTVIIRTSVGRAVFEDALAKALVHYKFEDNPKYVTCAETKIMDMSELKQTASVKNLQALEKKKITVIS